METLPRAAVAEHLAHARALVFAAEEDFGITVVEAQAAGTPVIAFGRGGVCDTVRPAPAISPTGLFFDDQTVPSICAAVRRFIMIEADFEQRTMVENARRFSEERFRRQYKDFVLDAYGTRQEGRMG